MRSGTIIQILLHAGAWSIIAALTIVVIRLKDHLNILTQARDEIRTTQSTAKPVLEKEIRDAFSAIQKNAFNFPQKRQMETLACALRVKSFTDSIFNLPNKEIDPESFHDFIRSDSFLCREGIANGWINHQFEQILACRFEEGSCSEQVWENRKLGLLFMQDAVFQFLKESSDNTPMCGLEFYLPILSMTDFGTKTGETVRADLVLEIIPAYEQADYAKYYELRYFIDHKPVSLRNGNIKIDKKYGSAGIFPLHASVQARKLRSDSLLQFEKTFYIQVGE